MVKKPLKKITMLHLKSSSILLSMCLFTAGCQSTPVFNIETFHTKVNDLHVIQVRADRIQQKCLFLNAEAENSWRHQYFMYILNDKNEVLEIMESTNQDRDTCHSQAQKIDKILRPASHVKICVRDELKKNVQEPSSENTPIQFGSLGKHNVNYEALTFDSICNSKKCLSNNEVWVNTCPGFVKH
jgi:hypothetical protein